MITLTNREALQFFSPATDNIFGNVDYKFPPMANHLLLVAVEKIRREFANLPKDHDAILNKYGKMDEKTGKMEYATPEDQEQAGQELLELHNIKREVNVKKVKLTDAFPAIAGFEMQILTPILEFEDDVSTET